MSSPELNPSPSPEQTIEVVIIDLEEYFETKKPHPEHHHQKVFHYRVKINEDRFVLKSQHVKGEELLSLVGKNYEKDQLFQIIRHGEEVKDIEISHEEVVDLSKHHTKKFFTHEKIFCFFVGKIEYRTHHEKLTARQILKDFVKVSPDTKTLAVKREGGYHEYKNLNEEIPVKDCPHFTLFDNTPTGLS